VPRSSPLSIRVDNRRGSKEYIPMLNKQSEGIAHASSMEFGDFAFSGNGPNGKIRIGVELKTLRDFAHSVESKRLQARQLPGMCKSYDIRWLIIEGVWKSMADGGIIRQSSPRKWQTHPRLVTGGREFRASRLEAFLSSCSRMRVFVWRTLDSRETVRWLISTARYWAKRDTDHGDAGLMVKESLLSDNAFGNAAEEPGRLQRARTARSFIGVGDKLAWKIADYFPSVKAMMKAKPMEWMQIEGLGVGIANKIVKAIDG